jgi:hypothetical protein
MAKLIVCLNGSIAKHQVINQKRQLVKMPKRKTTLDDFDIEFISIGEPDPIAAARAILPVILDIWNKENELDLATQQEAA